MIDEAKNCGADYIKFQALSHEELNKEWENYQDNLNYYAQNELKSYMYTTIIEKCKEARINLLFTAFSVKMAKMLVALGQKEVKIASPDADNWDLVEYCLGNFDRVFVSTGMISDSNLIKLRKMLRKQDVLFYCVSMYPTPKDYIKLDKMVLFDGFSDHTNDIGCAKKAIDTGIEWIERHFTLGKYLPGRDHKLSSTPDEVKELCDYRNYVAKCELFKRRWANG
jgi:sialic acid synthase SpsE